MLIAQVEAHRLLQLPSPERRQHEAVEEAYRLEAERDGELRALRKRRNKEAQAASLARLHASELGQRAAAREREMAGLMTGTRRITPAEAERALACAARFDRGRTA